MIKDDFVDLFVLLELTVGRKTDVLFLKKKAEEYYNKLYPEISYPSQEMLAKARFWIQEATPSVLTTEQLIKLGAEVATVEDQVESINPVKKRKSRKFNTPNP